MTKGAERLLMEYDYPGNVRELSNIIEYAVAICETDMIYTTDLPRQTARLHKATENGESPLQDLRSMTLKEIEKQIILDRLKSFNGHQGKTAESLGISTKGLRNKLHEYQDGN